MERWRQPGERLDALQRQGLYILQKLEGFRFGMDAVLLAHFAAPRPGARVVDLGTGTGILPLLMGARTADATFRAVELQPDMADMAARSVAMNGWQHRIQVYAMDWRDAPKALGYGTADAVVCNPPYGKHGATLINPDARLAAARHECEGTLTGAVASGALLLRGKGRLAMVFPAPRLLELLDAMRQHGLEPKRVRLVHQRVTAPPKLALAEAMKGVRPGLHWLPPLVLRDETGRDTPELRKIYDETQ
ncbi:MAG: tRNA1(Val) (adenine(37)-N6)-methyltransferase [Oscillospiraceae bacterium]|jgi:tRNA1(Val) A37 N6-methylase TrmN6|nr:tRNA1(Val) (adenine(37)-N6)-methyltransferase [Oscillospiraceae bacterium]